MPGLRHRIGCIGGGIDAGDRDRHPRFGRMQHIEPIVWLYDPARRQDDVRTVHAHGLAGAAVGVCCKLLCSGRWRQGG